MLWLYDTSRSELVYNDPGAGPLRFPLQVVADWSNAPTPRQLEVDLRRALPRADRSQLIVPGVRFL